MKIILISIIIFLGLKIPPFKFNFIAPINLSNFFENGYKVYSKQEIENDKLDVITDFRKLFFCSLVPLPNGPNAQGFDDSTRQTGQQIKVSPINSGPLKSIEDDYYQICKKFNVGNIKIKNTGKNDFRIQFKNLQILTFDNSYSFIQPPLPYYHIQPSKSVEIGLVKAGTYKMEVYVINTGKSFSENVIITGCNSLKLVYSY